jgi:hypothetical protein
MTDKSLPPLATDIKCVACPKDHVHLVLIKDGKELAEFVFVSVKEYNEFAMMLGATAIDAFVLNDERTTLQ